MIKMAALSTISLLVVATIYSSSHQSTVFAQLQVQPSLQPQALASPAPQVQPPPVQLPVQVSPAVVPVQSIQPLQFAAANQTNRLPTLSTQPIVKQTPKLDPKPTIKIEASQLKPPASTAYNKTNFTPPTPKNRMKILKSADIKPLSSGSGGDSPLKGFFSSLVDVDRATNKSKVGVHIPLIFDMTNDKDLSSGKSKLDLTVLSGLVSVNGDRENGKGPLSVTVFGIPIYTGTGNSGLRDFTERLTSTFSEGKKKFDDSIESVAGSRQLPDATMQLYSNVKRTGERGVMQLTDQLDKVSSFLKEQAAPILNTNGSPASKNHAFVTKPPAFKPEDLKPRLSESAFKKFAASANNTAQFLNLPSLKATIGSLVGGDSFMG